MINMIQRQLTWSTQTMWNIWRALELELSLWTGELVKMIFSEWWKELTGFSSLGEWSIFTSTTRCVNGLLKPKLCSRKLFEWTKKGTIFQSGEHAKDTSFSILLFQSLSMFLTNQSPGSSLLSWPLLTILQESSDLSALISSKISQNNLSVTTHTTLERL